MEELNAFDLVNMRGGTAIVRMLDTGEEGASPASGRGRTSQYLCRGNGSDALHAIVDAIAMVRGCDVARPSARPPADRRVVACVFGGRTRM